MKIMKFEASWCGPCKVLDKTLAKMQEFFTKNNIEVEHVNIEENDDLVDKYQIRSVPTLVFLDEDKEINRTIGNISENKIKEIINEKQ